MTPDDARWAAGVLALAFSGDPESARARATAALGDERLSASGRATVVAVTTFVDYVDARFGDALVSARRAVVLAADAEPSVQFLAATVAANSLANEVPGEENLGALDRALALKDSAGDLPEEMRWLSLALLVEACFANGQLGHAAAALAARDAFEPPQLDTGLASLQPIRVAFFGGRLDDARALCVAALHDDRNRSTLPLAHALLALIAAAQADERAARAELEPVADLLPAPARWIDGAACFVAGYALGALDLPLEARPWILAGGGGPELHRAPAVDRALGYGILMAASIAEGDLEGADLWARRSRSLYAIPSAVVAVEQANSRLALARGEAGDSQASADIARELARSAGRGIDAAAADLSAARAMLAAGAVGPAIDQFQATAHSADMVGAIALRRRASGELRRLGRRVLPRSGAGTMALSSRELEVANLAAEGFSSRQIGQSLFISERTVQAHLSRAMRALAVSNRAGLPAALGAPLDDAVTVAPLTRRQSEVAGLVREGLTNAEISARMSISVKTVEKHVASIFERWEVSSRTAISRRLSPTFGSTQLAD